MQRRSILFAAATATATLAAPRLARAWPDKPVRWIVPFVAGGPTDVFGRIMAERLAAKWGQPVVVENRPGAGTVVATLATARSAPDGTTLCMTISAFTLNPSLRAGNMPYDTLRDVAPVTQMGIAPVVTVAAKELPANAMPEVVALANRTPGGLSYGTAGVGTLAHLSLELLSRQADARLVHVPYAGFAPAFLDLSQGRIQLISDTWGGIRPHVAAGALKVLGVAGDAPVPGFPGLPKFSDHYPGIDITSSFGLVTAGGTPLALRQRVADDLRSILLAPEMAGRMEEFGMVPVGSSPEDYGRWIARDVARWTSVVRDAGIKVE